MSRRIFAVIFLIWVTASCVSADGRCQLLPEPGDDGRSIVYSCVEVTFDHVKQISEHANWIGFSVSKLQIPAKAFARFSLHTLSFHKCNIKYIDPNAFEGLVDLQHLTFWETNIHVLTASWLKGLTGLTHLALENTGLVYIEPKSFLETPNLQHLNIEDNNLNCLPTHALDPLRRLRSARIGKNPWLCSCHAELVRWMLNRQIDFGTKNATKMKFECMAGWYASRNTKLRQVFRNSSTSESAALTVNGIADGSCTSKTLPILSSIADNVEVIKLSGVTITTIPEFAFFQFGNSLRSLDMSNCSIRDIHPEAFAGLPKLEQLILFNNSITTMKAEWFRDLRGLRYLSLDSNGIKDIDLGVFPLLDQLEILTLEQNGIECIPAETFGLLKNLKRLNVAKNPWNCSCLSHFKDTLDRKIIASLGQCMTEKSQTGSETGDQYGSGYWSSSFQQNFTGNAAELNSQNFTESHSTFEEYHYEFPKEFASYYHQSSESSMNEAQHHRNKKSASYAQNVAVGEQSEQRVKQQRSIVQRCRTSNAQGLPMNSICPPGCRRVEFQAYPVRYFYECSGATLSDLNAVPDVAESIKFEYSTISVVPNYAFARFGSNLRSLSLSSCRIHTIEPQAFAGLVNLQELVISGNNFPEVRSAWFESTSNLQRLILSQNSISRIENSVFQFLPNLQHLVISDNRLNCIGIDSLHHMSRLSMMDVQKNPWSCLCRKKLIEWLNERHVNYNRDVLREYLDWDCGNETPYPINPINPVVTIRPTSPWATIRPTTPWATIPPTTTRAPIIPIPPTTPFQPLQTPSPPRPLADGKCKIIPPNSFHWRCTGGNLLSLDGIWSDAERIEIMNSTMLELTAESFARFTNLKELLFYNCSVGKIDNSAFRGLGKLKLLVFQGSVMSKIRSEWFHDLTALTELDLSGNHVTEVEGDVFEYLPSLKVFSLRDNDIQCIYTKSLSTIRNLQEVSLQNNPWKWRCLEELTQFLDGRNVNYTNFRTYRGKRISCELKTDEIPGEFKDSGTTNTSISTANVLCVSIAMLIFTKF